MLRLFGLLGLLYIHSTLSYEPKSAWETLFALDCKGTMHITPHSVIGMKIQTPIASIIKTLIDRIQSRVNCWCGEVKDEEFNQHWDPFTSVLFVAQKGAQSSPACTTGDKFARDIVKFFQHFLGDTFEVDLPDSCTYDSYKKDGCFFKVKIPDLDITLQLAMKRCGGTEVRHPFIGITCDGPGCRTFHPCKNHTDCGSSALKCYATEDHIGSQIKLDGIADVSEALVDVFAEGNFYPSHTQFGKEDPPMNDLIVEMLNYMTQEKYFPGSPDDLKIPGFCLPEKAVNNDLNWGQFMKEFVTMSSDKGECDTSTNTKVAFVKKADTQWDGNLPDGTSATAADRLDGALWGGTRPPIDNVGLSLFRFDCAGRFSIAGSEKHGIQGQFPSLPKMGQKLATLLSSIYTTRGLDNFMTNQAIWTADPWMCIWAGAECEKKYPTGLHETLFKGAFTSPKSSPTNYPLWTKGLSGGSSSTTATTVGKIVEQALTDHFNKHASISEKVKVGLGLKKPYPRLQATLEKLQEYHAKASNLLFSALSSQWDPTIMNSFQPSEGTRMATIPQEDGGDTSCSPGTWNDKGYCVLRMTAFRQQLGPKANLDVAVQRCTDNPKGVPSFQVYCKNGVCDDVTKNGGVCANDADCQGFGEGFKCQELLPQKMADQADFIGSLAWRPMPMYNCTGSNKCCTPFIAGIGVSAMSACDRNPSGSSCPVGKCYGAKQTNDDFNYLWEAVTGHKAKGDVLKICQMDGTLPTNGGDNPLKGFELGIEDGKYGLPSDKLNKGIHERDTGDYPLHCGGFFEALYKWATDNPEAISPYPLNLVPKPKDVKGGQQLYDYSSLLTWAIQKNFQKALGYNISRDAIYAGVYNSTWSPRGLSDANCRLTVFPETSFGTRQQQLQLVKDAGNQVKNVMTTVVGMTGVTNVAVGPVNVACGSTKWERCNGWCAWNSTSSVCEVNKNYASVDITGYVTGNIQGKMQTCSDLWEHPAPGKAMWDMRWRPNIMIRPCYRADAKEQQRLEYGKPLLFNYTFLVIDDFPHWSATEFYDSLYTLTQKWGVPATAWNHNEGDQYLNRVFKVKKGIVSVDSSDIPDVPGVNSAVKSMVSFGLLYLLITLWCMLM